MSRVEQEGYFTTVRKSEGWQRGGPLLALKMQVCFGPSDKESGGNIDFCEHEFAPVCGPFYACLERLLRDV